MWRGARRFACVEALASRIRGLRSVLQCWIANGPRRLSSWSSLLAVLLAVQAFAATAQVQYVYDELGRLVEVVAPNGESARYVYDPAGNIKQILRAGSTALTLAEFTPNGGPIGSTVTLYGTGFSTTPASNAVKFNGVSATVSSASINKLVVSVPASATTGPISVTVAASTVTSTQNYVVGAATGQAPTISSFTPTDGGIGTVVTLTGTNFDPDKANNLVQINTDVVPVTTATATQLTFAIPSAATSGKIRVTTPNGSVVSTSDLFIAPTGIANADITHRGRLVTDGSTATISNLQQAKNAQYLFDGAAGQQLGLGFSPLTFSPANGSGGLYVSIRRPDGTELLPYCTITYYATDSSDGCRLVLPSTGIYQIVVRPTTAHTVNLGLTLSTDLVAPISLNSSSAAVFSSTRPGQYGGFTFPASAGDSFSLVTSNVTIAGTYSLISVLGPDGTQLAQASVAPGSLPPPVSVNAVPRTGTYTILIDPFRANTGQAGLSLFGDTTAALAIDGSATAVNLAGGQNARYTFNAAAGQSLGLGIASLTTTPAGGTVNVRVYGPTGQDLNACALYGYSISGECNLLALPAAGTYTVVIDPQSSYGAAMSLSLSSEVVATLTPNAASATTFSTTRPGQNGRYSFSATAGQRYSVLPSNVTIAGTSTLGIVKPDGKSLSTLSISTGSTQALDFVAAEAGTYAVFVDPAAANTGQIGVSLRSDATGSLALDGAATAVNLLAGQNARYSFNATAGQNLGLGIASLATTPAGGSVYVRVYSPSGQDLYACDLYGYALSGKCNLLMLPASGTYTVQVDPQGAYAASLSLSLSSEIVGSLTANAANPTAFSTTRPGQNGRYTFAATAGQRYSVLPSSITVAGTSNVTVVQPDGKSLATLSVSTGSTQTIDFIAPETASYSILVAPALANTGQISIALLSDATGALALNGTATAVSLLAGQNARYTFTASAGQNLGLGFSGLSTTPAGGTVYFRVLAPSGQDLNLCGSGYTSANSCNLSSLPASGTYTVVVDPQGANAASVTLTLSSDLTGALTVNAVSATNFATTRPGQNGRYTFSGVAGQRYSVLPSAVTVASTSYLNVNAPDGKLLGSVAASTGGTSTFDFVAPESGTYTVFVDPAAANTGQIGVSLLGDATGSLALDGTVTAVSLLAGQNARYTFNATAGQNLGLGVSGLSTTPANGTVNVRVLGPTGQDLLACQGGAFSTGGECDLSALPATGTYVVEVNPLGANAASLSLTLSSDLVGTLTLNSGTPTSFSTSRPGQNGRYTFNGVTGNSYTLVPSAVTIPGTWTSILVAGPDGAVVGTALVASGYTPSNLNIASAPSTGVYTVFVDPFQAATGSVGITVNDNGVATPPGQTVNGTIAVDGSALNVSVPANLTNRYTFTGAQGQRLGLGVTALATTPAGNSVTISIYRPDNTTILASCYGSAAFSCNLPPLPGPGTYTVRVQSAVAASTSATLTLSSDVTGTLSVNAVSATTFSTTRPGQDGRYSFSGTTGQYLGLAWAGSTFASGTLNVSKPDGSLLNSVSLSGAAGYLDLAQLPASGTYIVWIDPTGVSTGQIALNLRDSAMPNLNVNGAATAINLAPGQTGRFSFSGSVGQVLGMALTSVATSPAGTNYVYVNVYDAAGGLVTNCGYFASAAFECNLPRLTQAGVYTVVVDPGGTFSMTGTLTLSSDVTAAITVNAGTATTFSTARPGQKGRYTFSGTAGQELSVAWSGSTLSGNISIERPDGTQQAGTSLSGAGGALDSQRLTLTGTHAVVVDPSGGSTGQAALNLYDSAMPALTVDGTPTTVNLAPGQDGRYTFTGVAGQTLGLGLSGVAMTPAGTNYVYVYVYDSAGTLFTNCGSFINGPGFSCNLNRITQPGTYTVHLNTPATVAMTGTLTLSSDVSGAIVANAPSPTTFSTTRPGQNGRYTFNGTAAQYLSVAWSGATMTGTLNVYKPDGTVAFSNNLTGASGSMDLSNLPVTGVYTLLVDGAAASTGQVALNLLDSAMPTVSIDGAAAAVSLAAGQNGRYPFTGTAGQTIGLALTNIVTSPAGSNNVGLSVYDPSGAVLSTCTYTTGTQLSCDPPRLPLSGTYVAIVDPLGAFSATATLTLSSDTAGTLAANAATTTFATTRPGQNGRYTFSGVAGREAAVVLTDWTFPGTSSYASVLRPDGTSIASGYSISPRSVVDLGKLSWTGTFTVFVDPGALTGQVGVAYTEALLGAVAVDATPTSITLVTGQSLLFDFEGTTGQYLGAVLTDLALGPAALSTNPITLELMTPAGGAVIQTCTLGNVDRTTCQFPRLTATGTYKLRIKPGPNSASFKLQVRSTI